VYPVMLNLRDRPVLVVGGGEVALRKVEGLLAEGARPTVISPSTVPDIDELERRGAITLRRRGYCQGDVAGFALVFAATDDREVNARASAEAREAGIWANVADDPELCSFHLPARVQRGALQIAIASDGGAPFVVRRLRQMLERRFGPEWTEWLEAATRFRQAVRALDLPRAAMERRWDAFFTVSVWTWTGSGRGFRRPRRWKPGSRRAVGANRARAVGPRTTPAHSCPSPLGPGRSRVRGPRW
jgi:precorrin-2 dehydrogenase/sirohydrochlorin ferrochelatase